MDGLRMNSLENLYALQPPLPGTSAGIMSRHRRSGHPVQTSRTENTEVRLAAVNRRVVGSSPTRGATRFHIVVGAPLVNGTIVHFWRNWPE